MLNVSLFEQDINMLPCSVVFIKNMNLMQIFSNKGFLKSLKSLLPMFSCEIFDFFRTAITRNIREHCFCIVCFINFI